jgi:hypothetical protein
MIGCVAPSSVSARRVVGSLVRRRRSCCSNTSHHPVVARPAAGWVQTAGRASYPDAVMMPLLLNTTTRHHRRLISTTVRLDSTAVFSGWSPLEWHKDTFLSAAPVQEKEAWLEAILASGDKSVDIEAFLLVLKALSMSADAGAPRRAEQWMKRLKEHPYVQPTTSAYQAVILAWAHSDKEQPVVVVNRAERWMNELLAMHEADSDSECLKPTIELYNAFLDACTRGRPGKNKRNQWTVERHAKKADSILRRLHSECHHNGGEAYELAPNTDTFNFVLRGWTRCQQNSVVVQQVMGLLRLMEAYQRSNPTDSRMRPNTKSYCLAMDALVRTAKLKAKMAIEDGRFSTHAMMNGINEMNEAEAILNYMHDLHAAGVEGVVPHRVPYNLLMTGWAALAGSKHFNAPFRAEEIIRSMFTHQDNGFTEASPDRISYERVMLAWANSCNSNAGKRSQWWLKKLWNDSELQGNKDLLPTVKTYNIAMDALARSEGALAAENLLLDMGDKYREEMAKSLCPNSESFAIVIKAWVRKGRQEEHIDNRLNALHRAVEWLTSLREIENENNLSTAPEQYHGVLRVARGCAKGRMEVLELAKRIFNDQNHSRHGLDVFSYSLLLEVGLEALSSPDADEERTTFIDDLFYKCCDDGLLGKHFVLAIVNCPIADEGWTMETYEDTMERLFHTLPLHPSWTRNIRSPDHMAKAFHFKRKEHVPRQAAGRRDEKKSDQTVDG